jgi:hypothetical protein
MSEESCSVLLIIKKQVSQDYILGYIEAVTLFKPVVYLKLLTKFNDDTIKSSYAYFCQTVNDKYKSVVFNGDFDYILEIS